MSGERSSSMGYTMKGWGTECQRVSLVWKSLVTVVTQECLERKLQRHGDNSLGGGGRREQKQMAQGQLGSPYALLGAPVVSRQDVAGCNKGTRKC